MKKTTTPQKKLPNKDLKFGASFTDHLFEINWKKGDGETLFHFKLNHLDRDGFFFLITMKATKTKIISNSLKNLIFQLMKS